MVAILLELSGEGGVGACGDPVNVGLANGAREPNGVPESATTPAPPVVATFPVEVQVQRGLNEGFREVNPVMRPFVTRGAAGEAAGSALGYGAAVGVAYWLHRSHHYKAERITMRLMVAAESGVVANNIIAIR